MRFKRSHIENNTNVTRHAEQEQQLYEEEQRARSMAPNKRGKEEKRERGERKEDRKVR